MSTNPAEEEPLTLSETDVGLLEEPDRPWITIVWDDPVNLMSYVVYVFQRYFGYSHQKATKLMFEVHHEGRAAVSSGNKERAERDAEAMHRYGLWATIAQGGD